MAVKITTPKQKGKADIKKIKGKSGYYIREKSGKLVYGGATIEEAKRRVATIVYFRDRGK